jgi:RNA-directed DNA polymerase
MKESRRKGVASHPDPESCVASREAAIEALTGAHAGRVSSCEIIATGVPTSFSMAEGKYRRVRYRKHPPDSAQSETPGMHGNSTRENRETPSVPASEVAAGRLEKAMSRKSSRYRCENLKMRECHPRLKCPALDHQPKQLIDKL